MTDWESLKLEAASVVHQEFGEPVRYHYAEGHTAEICVVFTMATAEVSMGGQVSVESRQPMCNIKRDAIERKPRQGDLLTRRNVTYEVKSAEETLDASFNVLLWAVDSRHAQRVRDRT